MKRLKNINILIVFLILSSISPVKAETNQSSLILTDDKEIYPIANHMEILEDPTAGLTINDVISSQWQKKFQKTENGITGFGFTYSAFWVKLKLHNQAHNINEWFLGLEYPYMDYIDFYEQKKNANEFSVKKTGILRPADTRDVSFNRFTFILPLSYNTEKVFYIRFETEDPMMLDLVIRSEGTYTVKKTAEYTWYGIFFGVLICMLFYNLFLVISIKEKQYIYYILVIIFFIIVETIQSGLGSLYIWRESPWLNRSLLLFCLCTAICMLKFSDLFLSLRTKAPWFHRLALALIALAGSLVLMFPFSSHGFVVQPYELLILFSMLAILAASLITIIRGHRQGRFFLIAVLLFFITLIINELDFLGAISISSSEINITTYQVGFLILIVLWSLAISDQINILKKGI